MNGEPEPQCKVGGSESFDFLTFFVAIVNKNKVFILMIHPLLVTKFASRFRTVS